MPAGRHGHKIREYKRRIDALLEAERERRKPPPPPPPPISEEHAAMRERIERTWGAVVKLIPEGTDLEEAMDQSEEIRDLTLDFLVMADEEVEFLASQGVDARPYKIHEPKF
jgi:succinate dehydrogenase/fumarate reductase flavoprotein subunit